MMFYYTTVLPAVIKLAQEQGVEGVFVFEDTSIVTPGVFFLRMLRLLSRVVLRESLGMLIT